MAYEPVTIREAARLEVLLFVGLAFVASLLIIYWGFQTYQFGRLIRDTPTERIRSLAMGRTQVEGTVVPATGVFDQPFTDGQCVYADFSVEEYREYPHDDDRDDQWETVQSETVSAPFFVDDGTGRILVDPAEETIYEISDDNSLSMKVSRGESAPDVVSEFLGGGASEGYDGPRAEAVTYRSRSDLSSVSGTSRPRKYHQEVLPVTDGIYVYGGASRRDPTGENVADEDIYLGTDPGTNEFIVSDADEFSLAGGYTKRSVMYIVAGLLSGAMILGLLAQILITGPVFGIDETLPWIHL